MHGAAFLALRVEGAMEARVRTALSRLWVATVVCFVAVTIATFVMRPDLATNWGAWTWVVLGVSQLISIWAQYALRKGAFAFLSSSMLLLVLLAAAARTMFPYLLRAYPYTDAGISIYAAAPSPVALGSALTVAIVGLVATIVYTAILWPKLAGKVRLEE
jgi:cytochrome bd-type quinol oxidase subunit 2